MPSVCLEAGGTCDGLGSRSCRGAEDSRAVEGFLLGLGVSFLVHLPKLTRQFFFFFSGDGKGKRHIRMVLTLGLVYHYPYG